MIRILNMRDGGVKALINRDEAIYIGRGPGACDITHTMVGAPGWLGNPHPVGFCVWCSEPTKHVVHRQEEAAAAFEGELRDKYREDAIFAQAFEDAMKRDIPLVCWCAPKACHGHIIVKFWKEIGTSK